MNRRDLLKSGVVAASLVTAGRAFAVPAAHHRLLVVFLRGAYDAANIVIPTGSDFYYASRPTIAVAKPNPADAASALPLDTDWALHPALKSSIYPLWQKRQVAFVPFAGTDDLTRSHFETQDTIELGQPLQGSRNYDSGFMSRLAGAMNGQVEPIAFTDRGSADLPRRRSGAEHRHPGARQAGSGRPPGAADPADVPRHQPPGFGGRGLQGRRRGLPPLASEMTAANRGAISAKGFELSARRIARLMRDEFNLAFVDVGGWDTHVNEGGGQGYLANRIGELGAGLAGFADEIGPAAWHDTTVVVISEFGRTFRENGDRAPTTATAASIG